jgi:hypothetical protein
MEYKEYTLENVNFIKMTYESVLGYKFMFDMVSGFDDVIVTIENNDEVGICKTIPFQELKQIINKLESSM